jgi:hypothetical protein
LETSSARHVTPQPGSTGATAGDTSSGTRSSDLGSVDHRGCNRPPQRTNGTGRGKIKFSHLRFDTTVYDWQGAQITLICFDELTHFTAHQFFYMVSNRSTCGVRPYIRATCNPDADSWVADFLAWWIDQETGLEKLSSEFCGYGRDPGDILARPGEA